MEGHGSDNGSVTIYERNQCIQHLLDHFNSSIFLESIVACMGADVEKFADKYTGTDEINRARRYVWFSYAKVKAAHDVGALRMEDIRMILNPGSVAGFVRKVIPLTRAKPGAMEPDIIDAVEAFWTPLSV